MMSKNKAKLKLYKIKLTETDIKRMLKDYLDIKGWFNFHLMAGMGSYKGAPDMIAIKDGRVLFIEAKRQNGKQSEYQKDFQKVIELSGGEYVLAKSIDDLIVKGV